LNKFAIFYTDGTVIEGGGEDDETITLEFTVSKKWLNAPDHGIQAVVVEQPFTCRSVYGASPYYIQLPIEYNGGGEIYPPENGDLGPYFHNYLQGMVKFGQMVSNEKWQEIHDKVKKYKGIPRDCDRQGWPS
jgi:hypothetical protein